MHKIPIWRKVFKKTYRQMFFGSPYIKALMQKIIIIIKVTHV